MRKYTTWAICGLVALGLFLTTRYAVQNPTSVLAKKTGLGKLSGQNLEVLEEFGDVSAPTDPEPIDLLAPPAPPRTQAVAPEPIAKTHFQEILRVLPDLPPGDELADKLREAGKAIEAKVPDKMPYAIDPAVPGKGR